MLGGLRPASLAVWGNGKLAASFEYLAEKVSELEYESRSAERS